MSAIEIEDRTYVDVEDPPLGGVPGANPVGGQEPPSPAQRSGGAKRNGLDPIKEALAVRTLRDSLDKVDADDEALLLDTIEGETQLFEIVDALLERMAANRAYALGLEKVIGELQVRADRFLKRVDADRALIEQAMFTAELPKIERPAATLFLAARQPKAEISEEADIPARFWRAAEPKLDKKAVLEALKAGEAVPGACLSNAAPSLTIRTL